MERIVDLLRQQAIRGHRALNVGSLQRNDDVSEVEVFKNLYVTQRRFDHSLRRGGAVSLQEIFFQRSAVDSDPNRHLLCLRGAHDFDDALVLADVAGIQTQLVDAGFKRHHCQFVIKWMSATMGTSGTRLRISFKAIAASLSG